MTTQAQLRRGDTGATDAFTGAEAELTVVTDDWSLRVHDGITPGGHPVGGGGGSGNPTTTAILTWDQYNPFEQTPIYTDGGALGQYLTWQKLEHGNNNEDAYVTVAEHVAGSFTVTPPLDTGVVYTLTLTAICYFSSPLPSGMLAYGTYLSRSGGDFDIVNNYTVHTRMSTNTSGEDNASIGNSIGFLSLAQTQLMWTDTYTLVAGSGATTWSPGLSLYSYADPKEIPNIQMIVKLQRLNEGPVVLRGGGVS